MTYQLQITTIKDFSAAQKYLPKFGFVIYKNIINAVYNTIVEKLGKKKMAKFNPVYEENKAIFTQKDEDKSILKKEEEELKNFLFSDAKDFREDEKVQKAMNNRWVMKVYNKTKNLIMDKIIKNNVLTFLNSMSIMIDWKLSKVEETKKEETKGKELTKGGMAVAKGVEILRKNPEAFGKEPKKETKK